MEGARQPVSPAKVFARPTADRIWLGPSQQAALSRFSKIPRGATRVLIGPPGSGKTTLLRHQIRTQGEAATVLRSVGPRTDARALLAALLLSGDLAPWELSEIEQRNLLTVLIQQRRSQRRPVVVLIDDADTLGESAWEEAQRLRALHVDRRPAVDLYLAGTETLRNRLAVTPDTSPAPLLCCHDLPPPDDEDVAAYIGWRLHCAGLADELFTPDARHLVARLAKHRFDAVDVLCQAAMMCARREGELRVAAQHVERGLQDLTTRVRKRKSGASAAPSETHITSGFLLISHLGQVRERVPLKPKMLLGRGAENDVRLEDPYLSRHHAVIVATSEGYYIIDLHSTNGLSLNGRMVTRAMLSDQDVISIGPFRMKFQAPRKAHDPPPEHDPGLADTSVLPAIEPAKPLLHRIK